MHLWLWGGLNKSTRWFFGDVNTCSLDYFHLFILWQLKHIHLFLLWPFRTSILVACSYFRKLDTYWSPFGNIDDILHLFTLGTPRVSNPNHWQTNRQTDRQAGKTDEQKSRLTGRQKDRQTEKWIVTLCFTPSQPLRLYQGDRERETRRQADRQADRQTDRTKKKKKNPENPTTKKKKYTRIIRRKIGAEARGK